MVTNGRGWGKQQAARAKSFRLESVAFSVDGCEVTHNYIRRVQGQWHELLESIDMTVAAGVPVSVVTQINRRNLGELEELHALLAAHGVRRWQLQLGNPSGNMADHPDLVISPADILDIVPRVARLRQLPGRPHVYAGDNIGYYGEHEAAMRDTGGLVPVLGRLPGGVPGHRHREQRQHEGVPVAAVGHERRRAASSRGTSGSGRCARSGSRPTPSPTTASSR